MKLAEYITNNNIKNIAVYGMNDCGKRWYRYLEDIPTVQHVFGIEKLNYAIEKDYEKYMLLEDELPQMDAILIVPWKEFDFVKWDIYSFVPDNCIYINTHDFADELI